MMRIIGILMISAGMGATGFLLAAAQLHEEKEIREGVQFLKRLTSRFDYLGEEFSLLFIIIAEGEEGKIAKLFLHVGERLGKENTAGEVIWKEEVLHDKENMYLSDEKIKGLLSLSALFSTLSKSEQSSLLHNLINDWELSEKDAHGQREKKVRMYRTVGLCFAVLFIIVFI